MAEVFGYSKIQVRNSLGGSVPFAITSQPGVSREPYRVIICDVTGAKYAELDNAVVTSVKWELNSDHSATFVIPSIDPKIVECKVPNREVQIWRGRSLIWWGILVRASSNQVTTEFQCQGLGWYFKKRVFGPIPKTELMPNGGFELGTSGWNPESVGGKSFSYFGVVKSPVFSGLRALRLSSANTSGSDLWARRSILYNVPLSADRPDTVTVVAWCFVSAFTAPAANSRGLWVDVRDSGNTVLYSQAYTTITSGTPKGKWIRFEASVKVQPRSATQRINVRLYVPANGTVYWDDVSVSADLRLGYKDAEQSAIFRGIVSHAQSTTYGKSDLNITPQSMPSASPVKRSREYLFYNHGVIHDALDEFPTLAYGMDWDISYTTTGRFITSYYPTKGVYRNNVVLELGRNIAEYQVDVDGETTANKIGVVAAGEGADREEAGSTDTSTMNGLVLEKVYNATPGSAPQSLKAQADRGLARYRQPVTIPQVTTYEGAGALLGAIVVGDTCRVNIVHGWINVNAVYRVLAIDLNPANEAITFTLQPTT